MIKSCSGCGYTRNTCPAADLCAACEKKRRYEHHCNDWKQQLDSLGFTIVQFDIKKGNHSKIEVTNNECGHTFFAQLNNIINKKTVCGVCGPTKRMAYALKHYVDKYGRTYDLKLWKDYKLQVEILSNKYYNENKATMNPNDFPRMKGGAHPNAVNLDHIIPIIYGFKNGLSPELIADGRNLRIICATQNLKKKQKLTDEARALLDSML